jgi:hypothetical protein
MEGNYLALADDKRAKAVLAREAKITDPKIVDVAYEDFKQQSPPDLEPTAAAAANTLAQFPGGGATSPGLIDTSLLDALKASGFSAVLQRKYDKQ